MIEIDFAGARLRLKDSREWVMVSRGPAEIDWTAVVPVLNMLWGPDWEPEGYEPDHLRAQARAMMADLGGRIVRADKRHTDPQDLPDGAVW